MAQPPTHRKTMEGAPKMSCPTARVSGRGQIRRRIRWSVVAAVLALIPASPAAAGVTVLDGAAASKRVEVIVQFKKGVSQAYARATIPAHRGRPGLALPIINSVSARLTAGAAKRLGRAHHVRAVTINRQVGTTGRPTADNSLATVFNQSVNADDVWSRATGEGVGVAVLDTGIAGDLPDFATSSNDSTSRVIASAVTNPDAKTAGDSYGHGTHVAGIIAGNGAQRPVPDGTGAINLSRFSGVAPDANLISV